MFLILVEADITIGQQFNKMPITLNSDDMIEDSKTQLS